MDVVFKIERHHVATAWDIRVDVTSKGPIKSVTTKCDSNYLANDRLDKFTKSYSRVFHEAVPFSSRNAHTLLITVEGYDADCAVHTEIWED